MKKFSILYLAFFGILFFQGCSQAPKMTDCMAYQMQVMGFDNFKGTELEMECIEYYKKNNPDGEISSSDMLAFFQQKLQESGFLKGDVSPLDYELKQGKVSCVPCAEKEQMAAILQYLYNQAKSTENLSLGGANRNAVASIKGSEMTGSVSIKEEFANPVQNFNGTAHALNTAKAQLVPMGWSDKGLLAYRYTTSNNSECGQSDFVYVINLLNDKITATPFSSRCFDASQSGRALNWSTEKESISKELAKMGIKPVSHFPVSDLKTAVNSKGQEFPLVFNVLKVDGSKMKLPSGQYGSEYSVTCTFNGETKEITKGKVAGDVEYVGYFQNPLEDRIGIVIRIMAWDNTGKRTEEYKIVGCHLDEASFAPREIDFRYFDEEYRRYTATIKVKLLKGNSIDVGSYVVCYRDGVLDGKYWIAKHPNGTVYLVERLADVRNIDQYDPTSGPSKIDLENKVISHY